MILSFYYFSIVGLSFSRSLLSLDMKYPPLRAVQSYIFLWNSIRLQTFPIEFPSASQALLLLVRSLLNIKMYFFLFCGWWQFKNRQKQENKVSAFLFHFEEFIFEMMKNFCPHLSFFLLIYRSVLLYFSCWWQFKFFFVSKKFSWKWWRIFVCISYFSI